MPGNALFDDIYGRISGARDADGALQYDALLALMDLEGIDRADAIDILEKTVAVEAVVAAERARRFKEQTKK